MGLLEVTNKCKIKVEFSSIDYPQSALLLKKISHMAVFFQLFCIIFPTTLVRIKRRRETPVPLQRYYVIC